MSSNNSITYPSVRKIGNTLSVFYKSSTKEETESIKRLTLKSDSFKRKPKSILGTFKDLFLVFLKFLKPNKKNFVMQIFLITVMSIPVYFLTKSMDFVSRMLIWIPMAIALLLLSVLFLMLCGVLVVLVRGKKQKRELGKEPEFSEEVKGRKVIFDEKKNKLFGRSFSPLF